MPQVHRHGDQRNCKATTIVSGQNAVYANNVLVSVLGDKNTHGGGELEATVNPGTIWINNKEMVVVGSKAKVDGLLHSGGGDGASTGSTNIWAFDGSDGTEENAVSCENEPVQLADPEKEVYEPVNDLPGGAKNPDPQVQPTFTQENSVANGGDGSTGGPHAKPNPEHTAGAAQAGKDATVKGETVPGKKLDTTLGALSGKFESNGNPGAVGKDSTGGFSYGEYQIATKTGTFEDYMNYLKVNSPRTYAQLQAAGGAEAAKKGSAGFQSAFQTIMANPEHAATQHNFIQASHYIPATKGIQNRTGIDVSARSKTLRDVAWSTSVLHGANAADDIFARALQRTGKTANTVTDAELISAIYDERGKKNAEGKLQYFRKSKPNVQSSVANRFINEKTLALSNLSAESAST